MALAVDKPPIFIFEVEDATSKVCVDQTHQALLEIGFAPAQIHPLHGALELAHVIDTVAKATLIMPGGKTLRMAEELRPVNASLRAKVAFGWNYLGICAGANLACSDLEMNIPKYPTCTAVKDLGMSFLSLSTTVAKFPSHPIEKVSSTTTLNGRKVTIISTDSEGFVSYWMEGSSFDLKASTTDKVTAVYHDAHHKPAAISGSYGKGKFYIMGFHPEITGFPTDDPILKSDVSHSSRMAFLKRAFEYFG